MPRFLRFLPLVLLALLLLTAGVPPVIAAPLAPAHTSYNLYHSLAIPPPYSPTPTIRARAREHLNESLLIYFATLAWEALILAAFFLLGGTRLLAALARRAGPRWWLAVLLIGVICLLAWTLLLLPFDLYGGYYWPHRWGLSHETLLQWAGDWAIGALVNVAITLALLVPAYAIIRKCPRTWWFWMGMAAAPLIVAGVLLQPLIIDPLTNHFTPLPDSALRQDILTLAAAQGVPLHDIFVMDASRQGAWVNAYVTGIGPSRRMVIYDNLLTKFPPEEVLFIAAHELGHAAHHDIPVGMVLAILGTFAAFWLLFHAARFIFTRWRAAVLGGHVPWRAAVLGGQAAPTPQFNAPDVADPAGFPVLMTLALLLMIVATPIVNSLTRVVEARADHFAITAYPHPAVAASAFHRLAALNLSDEDPPAWVELLLSSHPSTRHRIEAVTAAAK